MIVDPIFIIFDFAVLSLCFKLRWCLWTLGNLEKQHFMKACVIILLLIW